MDITQWAQVSSITNNDSNATIQPPQHSQQSGERRTKPTKEQALLKCPRCNSTNTKFCYYNNYSLTQPRYICKGCKRYWTQGGSLRSVPVGGGSRKNKKHPCSSMPSSAKINYFEPTNPMMTSSSFMTRPHYQGQELNLGFAFGASYPNIGNRTSGGHGVSSMELLSNSASAIYGDGNGGISTIPGISSSNIKFPLNGVNGDQGMQLFSFGDVERVKSDYDINETQNKGSQGRDESMLWNGGSW